MLITQVHGFWIVTTTPNNFDVKNSTYMSMVGCSNLLNTKPAKWVEVGIQVNHIHPIYKSSLISYCAREDSKVTLSHYSNKIGQATQLPITRNMWFFKDLLSIYDMNFEPSWLKPSFFPKTISKSVEFCALEVTLPAHLNHSKFSGF